MIAEKRMQLILDGLSKLAIILGSLYFAIHIFLGLIR
jgi:hypothetical protein